MMCVVSGAKRITVQGKVSFCSCLLTVRTTFRSECVVVIINKADINSGRSPFSLVFINWQICFTHFLSSSFFETADLHSATFVVLKSSIFFQKWLILETNGGLAEQITSIMASHQTGLLGGICVASTIVDTLNFVDIGCIIDKANRTNVTLFDSTSSHTKLSFRYLTLLVVENRQNIGI